ncbi:hypothetical protein [Ferrovibrio sp.]|uniref:hypothetical protein n=1 Tax=Ferrovibrio sp. TaxID=1917215 RepID=UPI0035AE30CB
MSEVGRVGTPPPAAVSGQAQPAPAQPSAADGANKILDSGSNTPQQTSSKPQTADAVRTSEVADAAKSGRALDAQVAARDGNALVLRSQGGSVLVLSGNPKLVDFLVPGATLSLQVKPGTPPGVTLLSANGVALQPPLSALLGNPTPTQLALAVPQPGQAQTPLLLPQAGQMLQASVLPLPAQGQTQASAMPGQTPPVQNSPAALQGAALQGTALQSSAAQGLPAGAQAQLVVRAAAMPGQPLPPVAAAAQIAVALGQNAAGQTLLRLPQGLLALDLPQPLPAGTQLALELAGLTRPGTAAASVASPSIGVMQRLQAGWPAMQQTLDVLRGLNPGLADRLAQALPQPNARLAANALQFMAASALGNAQAWLGTEASRVLREAGRQDLLSRLDEDFRDLGKLNQRGGDSDWQALTMPMLVQGKVEPVQIFMRRRRDKKKQQGQTRFIIDFTLESTGPLQFDGFLNDKRFDLILRADSEFGPAFRLDVQRIFDDAIAIGGMTGTIQFHDREPPIPWPSPELEAKSGGNALTA